MTEFIAAICINGLVYKLERPAHLPEGHQDVYVGWSYPTEEPCIARQDVQTNGSGESKFTQRMKARKAGK